MLSQASLLLSLCFVLFTTTVVLTAPPANQAQDLKRKPRVDVLNLKRSNSLETVHIPGEVTARSQVNVETQTEGQVVEIFVELGKPIKRGQPFLTVQNPDPVYTDKKIIVPAPISGLVADIVPHVGQKLHKDDVVGLIVDAAKLQVLVNIPGHYQGTVSKSSKALLTLSAPGGKTTSHPLTVAQVSPSLDPSTGTLKAYLFFDDPAPQVTIGALGQVTVNSSSPGVLLLPQTAVDKANSQVQVVVDSKVQRRQVALGRVLQNNIEILSGLKDGDMALKEFATWLHNNDTVEANVIP